MRITDIEPYSGYGDPIYHRYLEFVGENRQNKSGQSDKFWEVAVFKPTDGVQTSTGRFVVVRRWGKYGKKGQTPKQESFYGPVAAKDKARALTAKKRKEGYTKEIDIVTRLGMQLDEEEAA